MNKRKKSVAEIEAEEEENEDERRAILKDGERVRVSLLMRDGSTINPDLLPHQRAKALAMQQQPLVSDGSSNPMAMHKPGFRYLADHNQRAIGDAAKAAAYQEVETPDANAWKGATRNQATGQFSKPPAPGPQHTFDAKRAAYEEYDREMSNAWRK